MKARVILIGSITVATVFVFSLTVRNSGEVDPELSRTSAEAPAIEVKKSQALELSEGAEDPLAENGHPDGLVPAKEEAQDVPFEAVAMRTPLSQPPAPKIYQPLGEHELAKLKAQQATKEADIKVVMDEFQENLDDPEERARLQNEMNLHSDAFKQSTLKLGKDALKAQNVSDSERIQ